MFIEPPHPLPRQTLTIGLFGGSFDPVHEGHWLVATRALKQLRLDAVWWLLTPGNPLKTQASAPYAQRLQALKEQVAHPRMHVCDIEQKLGLQYTVDTIQSLQTQYPHVRFVFIAGFDSALSFQHWKNWRTILQLVPVYFVNRAPERIGSVKSPLRNLKNVRHVVKGKRTALATYGNNLILWDTTGPANSSASRLLRQRSKT